ncbi:MAG: putative motility protein [Roseibium sp.]
MDSVGIANSYVAMTQAQTGQALQAAMMKMASQQDASLVAMLEQGAESLQSAQAAPAPGLGGQVDVTA